MFKYLYKERFRILTISVLYSTLALFAILPFDFFGGIIDGINNKSLSLNDVLLRAFIMMGVALCFYILQAMTELYVFMGHSRYQNILQRDVINKVTRQTPVFFEKLSIGEIMGRMTSDIIDHVAPLFAWGMYAFGKGVLETGILFIYLLFKIDWKFALLINLPYIIVTFIIIAQKKNLQRDYKKVGEHFDEISKKTLESIKGVRIVRAYNMREKLRKEYFKNLSNYSDSNLKYSLYGASGHSLNVIAYALSYFFLILYGYYAYTQGIISFGDLVGASLVLNMLPWPYSMLVEFIIMWYEANIGFERLNEILEAKDVVDEEIGTEKLKFSDCIEFKNYSFHYGDFEALHDINLHIKKGQTIGIIGKTGSGKTTLIKQLLRFYPSNATIFIDQKSIDEYDVKSLRSNFGYAPQEYFIFSQTIRENILFNRDLEDRLEEALEVADFKKDVNAFKDGLDTLVGENGVSLSGGQKQRLSIARALIGDPEILLLDDTLSALDINTEQNIITRLKQKRAGKTNIIVSHRISGIIHADIILLLNNGRIEYMGTHQELLEKSKWYHELYEYQSKREEKDEI